MNFKKKIAGLGRRLAASAMAVCLAATCFPAVSLADDLAVSGTFACSGGWVLTYEASGGAATVTGVDATSAGAGKLTLPAALPQDSSVPIKAIAPRAFMGESADKLSGLTEIAFPGTLEIIGERAFQWAGLTSVTLPKSLKYIPYNCFFGCSDLAKVDFEDGIALEYIGTAAFMKCSSLTEITIPPLTGTSYKWVTEPVTNANLDQIAGGSYRIGYQCFVQCSKLATITFLPGAVAIGGKPGTYLKDGGTQFSSNADDMKIICYCKGSTSRYGGEAKWYFAVDFYESEVDALADTTHAHPWKTMLYGPDKEGDYPKVLDILDGSTDFKALGGSDALPALPAAAKSAGKVWGVWNSAAPSSTSPNGTSPMKSASTTLAASYDVFPVDRENLNFGWVSSPEIVAASASSGLNIPETDNAKFVRLRSDNTADLRGMAAYAADGTKLDDAVRTLKYEVGESVVDPDRPPFTKTEWTELASEKDVNKAGTYRVHAVGASDSNKGTETSTVEFKVKRYDTTVSDLSSTSFSESANEAVFEAVAAMDKGAQFMTVAPASSWQRGLLAVGMAGVGGGQAVFSDGSATADALYRAIATSRVDQVNFVGSEAQIGSAVVNRVKSNVGEDGAFAFFNDADLEALSIDAYKKIKRVGKTADDPYSWGSTAVVASQTRTFATSALSQYVYRMKAPVFFTNASGSLGAKTAAALAEAVEDGSITSIVVAGDESYVSADVVKDIEAKAKLAPQRLYGTGSTGFEASKDIAAFMQKTFTDDSGEALISPARVVVASTLNPAYVMAAAQLATAHDAVLLVVASSADVKAAQRYVQDNEGELTDAVYLVGDYSQLDPSAAARLESVWDTPRSTDVAVGDTVEIGGVVYKLNEGGSANVRWVPDKGLASFDGADIEAAGERFAVNSIDAGAFSGCTALKTFATAAGSLGAGALSGCTALTRATFTSVAGVIPANTFKGCAALTGVTFSAGGAFAIGTSAFEGCSKLGSVPVSASSIGASAFKGCTSLKSASVGAASIGAGAFSGCIALTSATLSSGALTNVPASAFSGCKALASVKVTSGKLASVGTSAFSGCAKLKSVSLASKKLASIGAQAFSGCTALKTATFKSTSLKTIGKQAFYNCKALKTVTFASKKLGAPGAKAFTGTPKKITVKAPKAKLKKYAKAFKKAGISKKAKFKKA